MHYVQAHAFAGLTIGFEELSADSQPLFHTFLKELGTWLHAAGLQLVISVQAEQQEIQLARLAELCDLVVVMAFDQHWRRARRGRWPASTGSRRSPKSVARNSPQKLVWGFGNYGYDWVPGGATASKTFDEVMLTAAGKQGHAETGSAVAQPDVYVSGLRRNGRTACGSWMG